MWQGLLLLCQRGTILLKQIFPLTKTEVAAQVRWYLQVGWQRPEKAYFFPWPILNLLAFRISYRHTNLIPGGSWAFVLFYQRWMVMINVKKMPEAPKHLGVFLTFSTVFICPIIYHSYSQTACFPELSWKVYQVQEAGKTRFTQGENTQ